MKQSNFSFYFIAGISLFGSIANLFGILAKVNHSAAFILFLFACIYFIMSLIARKNFSIFVLIFFIVIIIIQMGYLIYLENRFTPLPVLCGTFTTYLVIQEYKDFMKKKEIPQQVGDL